MKTQIVSITKSLMAGIIIAIAAFCYLMIDNPIAGSVFFSTGLLIIIVNKLSLYTGQIGYTPFLNDPFYEIVFVMVRTLFFNIVGATLVAFAIRSTYLYSYVSDKAINLVNEKIAHPGSGFVLGMFCGALILTGIKSIINVEESQYAHEFYNYLVLILCVSTFVICKFDHCIANVFYIVLSKTPIIGNVDLIGFWVLTLLGNTVGAILAAYMLYIDDVLG